MASSIEARNRVLGNGRVKLNLIIANPEMRASLEKRFWAKVDRRSPDECWPWIAKAKHPFGYGRMTAGRGFHLKAHQVAYALENGSLAVTQCVCHECDNPSCCNVRHLFLGTHLENVRDMRTKGRWRPPPRPFGENHPSAKFSNATGIVIANDKRPAAVVAEEYGISAKTVYCLRRGNARKELVL